MTMLFINDPILILFGIGAGGALFFILVKALFYNNPHDSEKLKSLHEKRDRERAALQEIYLKQAILLNQMATDGTISKSFWVREINRLIFELRQNDFDSFILYTIPQPVFPNRNELVTKMLNIANTLDDSKDLSKEEFEQSINTALDNYEKQQ